jgi:hypothetical protein
MRIDHFLSSEEFDSREAVRQARMAEDAAYRLWPDEETMASTAHRASANSSRRLRRRSRKSPELSRMSDAALRLLRHSSQGPEPVLSRSGIRVEARRVRSIMTATIREQQLTGGR